MIPVESLLLFIVASVLMILTPGQDMYLVMTRSVSQGARAGIITAAGISTGLLGHTLIVGLGLGAVIRASETVFIIMKIIGALYLIWLAVGILRQPVDAMTTSALPPSSSRKLFVYGALSNLVNPKIVIFYLAFLPQFVAVDASRPTISLLLLGTIFAALTFIIKAPIGMAAGALSSLVRRNPSIQRWINRISAGVLVILGIRLLLARETP
ncbi:MAG: threonine transporter RhtB [marine bacterium B5-7]|nr:MAG: threonine transporter RhtB [marine bacterium B5-7]